MSFNLTKEHIKVIQHELNYHTAVNLTVDGIKGPNTLNAVQFVNQISPQWPEKRQLIAVIQYACAMRGIDGGPIDGLWGPQTEHGYELLKTKVQTGSVPQPWRSEEGIGADPSSRWPIQRTDKLMEFYGDVGTNQTKITSPYTMKLAWKLSTKINRWSCHKLVKEPMEEALERILDHYTLDGIKELRLDVWGGCLNVRKMRGGTSYSTHSWGIAMDFDPENNKLRWGSDKASFARPEYEKWWEIWESVGATSLGRCKNYDWMHLQFADAKCD